MSPTLPKKIHVLTTCLCLIFKLKIRAQVYNNPGTKSFIHFPWTFELYMDKVAIKENFGPAKTMVYWVILIGLQIVAYNLKGFSLRPMHAKNKISVGLYITHLCKNSTFLHKSSFTTKWEVMPSTTIR